jgi:hypothetical protein
MRREMASKGLVMNGGRDFFENWEKRRDQKKTDGGKTGEEGKEKQARLSSDYGWLRNFPLRL